MRRRAAQTAIAQQDAHLPWIRADDDDDERARVDERRLVNEARVQM